MQYPIAVVWRSPVARSIASSAERTPSLQVIVERQGRVAFVRVDPGDHEDGVAALDRPADERIVRPQIEDIELVDPGRNDQERFAVDRLGARLVLNELHHRGLADDRPGAGGDVAAHLEGVHVGLSGAQPVLRVPDVFREPTQSAHQAFAPGLPHFAQHHRIGQREVGRREGVHDLTPDEVELVGAAPVEPFDPREAAPQPARVEQVGLLEEIEDRIVRPFRIPEPVVARLGLDYRRGIPAHHPGGGGGPQRLEVVPEFHLGFEHPGGIDIDFGRGRSLARRILVARRRERRDPVRPAFLPLLGGGPESFPERGDGVGLAAPFLVFARHPVGAIPRSVVAREASLCRRRAGKKWAWRDRHAHFRGPSLRRRWA